MPPLMIRSWIGLLQGLALAGLYVSNEQPLQWPATQPFVFVPFTIILLYVPFLIMQAIGMLRTKTLAIWSLVAVVVLFSISCYAVFRQVTPSQSIIELATLFFVISIPLFISHVLILSSEHDQHFIAHYPTYFDLSWKLVVQIVLATIFTVIFWSLLYLGVALFEIIHVNFFKKIITNTWFAAPATTLAVAFALHITDVKINLIQGIRAICLVLLSWLLPLITGIISIFLISLLFTQFSFLWQMEYAISLLIVGEVWLILLINAVYQDGKQSIGIIQRYSATLAGCLLVPLTLLAIYVLHLRTQQFGWTVVNINTAACLLVAIVYACGYTLAIFKSEKFYKRLENCNIIAAFLIVIIYLALLSPLADPARLMVANQMSRLQNSQVAPEKFDFNLLRKEGLRFGHNALEQLAITWQGPQANFVRAQAKATLAIKNDFANTNFKTRSQLIIVHTKDGTLPATFLKQKWEWKDGSIVIPMCLISQSQTCQAWMMSSNDKLPLILILDNSGFTGFKQNRQGIWQAMGTWQIPYSCRETMQNASTGKFKMVAAKTMQPDIEINGWRAFFKSNDNMNPCH